MFSLLPTAAIADRVVTLTRGTRIEETSTGLTGKVPVYSPVPGFDMVFLRVVGRQVVIDWFFRFKVRGLGFLSVLS